jgi:dolichyl-phosphate-mannose-protein mannosyltransferase
MLTDRQKERECGRTVLCFAVAAFVLQLALAAVTQKYPYDASCFGAWAARMAEVGPGGFYAKDYFCDYPPGYMLLLWLPGMLLRAPGFPSKLSQVVLAFWPALAGVGITMLVYRIGCRFAQPQTAKRIAIFAAFCQAILYDTSVWGQIDSVFALLTLCCFALLEEKRYLPGALFYGMALAVKPQALLVGPALAVCFLWPVIFTKKRAAALRQLLLGILAALLPPVLCGLPFWGIGGLWTGLWNKYGTTTASYPYASINACNLMGFMGGEWQSDVQPIAWLGSFALPSWRQLGTVLLLALTAWMVCWAWRAQKAGRFSPLLTAAVYGIGVFTVGHCMHERYLIFAAVLLLGASARWGDKRLLSLAGGFSLTSLLNMALVYGTVGTDAEYLGDAVSCYMQRWTGLAETALFALLAAAAWGIAVQGELRPFAESAEHADLAENDGSRQEAKTFASYHTAKPGGKHSTKTGKEPDFTEHLSGSPLWFTQKPAPQPAWKPAEKLFFAGLTVAVAVLSFVYLGSVTAPQNCLDANGKTQSFTLTTESPAAQVWIYTGISSDNAGHVTVAAQDGTVVAEQDLNWGTCFNWHTFLTNGASAYTVTLTDGQIFEMAFRDADGALLKASCDTPDAENVIDEPGAVPDTISQLNTFYFDEIYHARTGYEMLHGMTVYETTHPPLGKDFIALGIAIFGMTGFGWRFFGTLFGVLLVPLLYCFVRRLTRNPKLAAFAGILLSFDFMRFSQSRIATIDTYAVFFILLAVDGMVWYCQRVLTDGVKSALWPMLGGGAAFGLACASKWTGIYAGAGLAVLYFSVLAVRRRQLDGAQKGREQFRKEFWFAIGGGVVCFVILPLAIYFLSYAPYWFRDPGFGLKQWWGCQTYMYWYHSTLDATHPFSSNWYSWLLNLRPVWYYSNGRLPAGTYASIAGFLSPVVAIAGLWAWLRTAQRQLIGEGGRAGGVLIVALLSSLLPWVMVTRCTFLYHYFPCVPFLAAALALELGRWGEAAPKRARRTAIGILAAAGAVFVWFYPVLSGLPVSGTWAASLQWLESWGFYIIS